MVCWIYAANESTKDQLPLFLSSMYDSLFLFSLSFRGEVVMQENVEGLWQRQSETVQRQETGEWMNETAERLDQNVWIYIEHQSLLILPPSHHGGSQPFCGIDSSCNPSDLLQDYSSPSSDLASLQKIHINTCQTHTRCHLNFKRYISTVTSASCNLHSKCNSSLLGLPQT